MTVWRIDGAWQCFTACPNRGATHEQMLGTFLQLADDGTAYRGVWRPDGNDELEKIK